MAFADSATLKDDFNRSDGALGASWPAKVSTSHDIMVVNGNRLRGNISGLVCSAHHTDTIGPDAECYVTVNTWHQDGLTLYLRLTQPNASGRQHYLANFSGATPTVTLLKRISGGSTTQVGTTQTFSISNGDKLGFSVEDSGSDVVMRAWIFSGGAWSQIHSVTDSTSPIAGSGYAGVDTWQNNVYLDDFFSGTVSASGNTYNESAVVRGRARSFALGGMIFALASVLRGRGRETSVPARIFASSSALRANARTPALGGAVIAVPVMIRARARLASFQTLRISAASEIQAQARLVALPSRVFASSSVLRGRALLTGAPALILVGSSALRAHVRISDIASVNLVALATLKASGRIAALQSLVLSALAEINAQARTSASPSISASGEAALIASSGRLRPALASLVMGGMAEIAAGASAFGRGALVLGNRAVLDAEVRLAATPAMLIGAGVLLRASGHAEGALSVIHGGTSEIHAALRMGSVPSAILTSVVLMRATGRIAGFGGMVLPAAVFMRGALRTRPDGFTFVEPVGDDLGIIIGADYSHGVRMSSRRASALEGRRGPALEGRNVR
jgi:hypothetical protein